MMSPPPHIREIAATGAAVFGLIPHHHDRCSALENAHHLRDMVESDRAIQKISEGQAMIFSDDIIYIDEPWILTKAWLAKIIVYLGKPS